MYLYSLELSNKRECAHSDLQDTKLTIIRNMFFSELRVASQAERKSEFTPISEGLDSPMRFNNTTMLLNLSGAFLIEYLLNRQFHYNVGGVHS